AWPDANQLPDGSSEAAIDGEQGFEHIFGERAGDQISERRRRPCHHASYRKDSPLKSGGNLALPDGLTTTIDESPAEEEEESRRHDEHCRGPHPSENKTEAAHELR